MPRSPFLAAVLAAAALAACSNSPTERAVAPAPPPSITEAIVPSARAEVPPAPERPATAQEPSEPTAAEKAEFARPVRK